MQRALAGSPEALASALQKMRRKAADVAKCGAIVGIVLKRDHARRTSIPALFLSRARACIAAGPHRRARERSVAANTPAIQLDSFLPG